MVRCLFFEDSKKLQSLASVLEQSSNLGWWTRRLHVKRFYEDSNDTMDSLVAKLVAIIRVSISTLLLNGKENTESRQVDVP